MTAEGIGSIGLIWYERRPINTLGLQFADSASMPGVDGVKVQVWVGTSCDPTAELCLGAESAIIETLWQGRWVTLPGSIERHNDRIGSRASSTVKRLQEISPS